jgi:hypothetical protein
MSTFLQIQDEPEIIEFYNFHYSIMLTNLINDFGNDSNCPIILPNDFDNKGISNQNLKQLSSILKDFPVQNIDLDKLIDSIDILDYNKRFQLKYYQNVQYLKLFDKLSNTNIISLLKLCNFLGIDFLIGFLSELLTVKIKNLLHSNNSV